MVGHVGEHLPWGWLAFAVLATVLARYASNQVKAAEEAREAQPARRRPLRRRRALARAKRSRATRAARNRRRLARHLRRRRKYRARARRPPGLVLPGPGPSPHPRPEPAPPPPPGALDIDGPALTGPVPDSVAAPAEIDLRDSVVHDSEVLLESGDRLESGIVGWTPRR